MDNLLQVVGCPMRNRIALIVYILLRTHKKNEPGLREGMVSQFKHKTTDVLAWSLNMRREPHDVEFLQICELLPLQKELRNLRTRTDLWKLNNDGSFTLSKMRQRLVLRRGTVARCQDIKFKFIWNRDCPARACFFHLGSDPECNYVKNQNEEVQARYEPDICVLCKQQWRPWSTCYFTFPSPSLNGRRSLRTLTLMQSMPLL